MRFSRRAAEAPQSLVGWRRLHDQDAIFRNPTDTLMETCGGVVLEQMALLKIRASRSAVLQFMIGRVVGPWDQSQLLVADEARTAELLRARSFIALQPAGLGNLVLRSATEGSAWIGKSEPFEAAFRAAGCHEPACVEAGIELNGQIRLQDLTPEGTMVRADWSGAFSGAGLVAPADEDVCGQVVRLTSKSIS